MVWNDANNNGIKDATENGIPNIEVILYSTIDGTKGNSDDVAVDTMMTDSNGNYLFTGLLEGNYWVKLNNVPSGMLSSNGNGATNIGTAGTYEPSTQGDVNNVDHGTAMLPSGVGGTTMVMSNITVLSIYGEPANDGDTSTLTNLTVDFPTGTSQRPVEVVAIQRSCASVGSNENSILQRKPWRRPAPR